MNHARPDPAAVRQLIKLASAPPDGRPTDRELVEQFLLDRSDGAFADLMARHGPMVLAVCRRHLRDAHSADDAFQATFLVLARRAGSVRWRASIGGWLFEVATRVARKTAGQLARRNTRESCTEPGLEPAAPEPPADLTALQVALDDELRKLPEQLRTPIVLCHLEGLSQDEVAWQLSITAGQLRGRLYRAKERLRERLIRRGFSLTAALLALAVSTTARAVPAALAVRTLQSATAVPNTIPNVVHQLAEGVIRDMTTTFKTVTALALLSVLGLAATGFAVRAARTDTPPPATERAATPPHEPPKVPNAPPNEPGAPPDKPDGPKTPEPEWNDRLSGFVRSVDVDTNKLFVNYDHSGHNRDAGITALTKILFAGKPAKLADLAPGMRVYVIWSRDSNDPAEVRAHWPPLLPDVTRVNVEHLDITFETKGEHGIPLEVTLLIAPDMRPTVDGAPGLLSQVPHGKGTWVSLSSDRKSVIGLSVFTKAYDITGQVRGVDVAKQTVTFTTAPDRELMLPVAADAQVVVDGARAKLKDVTGYMHVLLRRNANGTSITGIVAVSELVALPEPKHK